MGENKNLYIILKDVFFIVLIIYLLYVTKIVFGVELIKGFNIYVVNIGMFIFLLYSLFHYNKYRNDFKGVNGNLFSIYRIIGISFISISCFYFIDFINDNVLVSLKDYFQLINLRKIMLILNVFLWVKIYISFYYFNSKEEKEDNPKNDLELYPSRKVQGEILKNYLDTDNDLHSFILIDGEWGIGKTTFVDIVLKEAKYQDRQIYINAMLFNNKKEIVKVLFDELENYLEENKICAKGLEETRDYIVSIMGDKISFLSNLFQKKESYSSNKDKLSTKLALLHKDKKPIIVIDNIERIQDKNQILEILGFLHEVEGLEGIKTLVLADRSKIEDLGIHKDYLDKFFIQSIQLREVFIEEILEYSDTIKDNLSILKFYDRIVDTAEKEIDKYIELFEAKSYKLQLRETFDEKINEIKRELNKFKRDMSNPRTISIIWDKFKNIKEGFEDIFDNFESSEHMDVLLSLSYYKYIHGAYLDLSDISNYNIQDLRRTFNIRRGVLGSETDKNNKEIEKFINNFGKNNFLNILLYRENQSGRNLHCLQSINYEFNDIIKAKQYFENIKFDINIKDTIKYINIYSDVISDVYDKKLIEFFKIFMNKVKNKMDDFPFYDKDIDFENFLKLDRLIWISGGHSIFYVLFKHLKKEIKHNTSKICKTFLSLSNILINDIFKIGGCKYDSINGWYLEKKLFNEIIGINLNSSENKSDYQRNNAKLISDAIEEKIKGINDDNLKIKELEYFLLIYKEYFSLNGNNEEEQEEKELNNIISKIKSLLKNIERLKNEISKIKDLSIENQIEIYLKREEIDVNKKELLKNEEYFLGYYYQTINNNDDLAKTIRLYKELNECGNEFRNWEYNVPKDFNPNVTNSVSNIYMEFVKNKDFERDENFEKILRENRIDLSSLDKEEKQS